MNPESVNTKRLRQFVAGLLLAMMFAQACHAEQAGDKKDFTFSGIMVMEMGSCTFNTASQSVNFGNISYSSANGFALKGEYRQPLNSEMTCTGDTDGSAIMTFASSVAPINFNGKKLLPVMMNGAASNNLGIQLLVNGVVQDVGVAFNVDMATPPAIEAELVQIGSSDTVRNNVLWVATVSLTMAYQ